MIKKQELIKTVRSTRTYRFQVVSRHIDESFEHIQKVRKAYFNYGLKYLYQHYGEKKLQRPLPTGTKRKYLVNKMIKFARQKALKHKFNLKNADYNVQSIAKMYEELLVAFEKYRHGQYKLKHYWSEKQKENYLATHNCGLSGYMRIEYKHDLNDIRSARFKQNREQLRLVNNYVIHLPYFQQLVVKESLASLKHKDIQEMCVVKHSNGDYELQIIVKFQKTRNVSQNQVDKAVGLDINLANDDFFVTSDNQHITWPRRIKNQYIALDCKARQLQTVINAHNHGNDNSKVTKNARKAQSKTKAKMANIIDEWQLLVAKQLVNDYPVLAIEQLDSFKMRLSKRDKRYLRKHSNNKLAKLQPSTFRKQMECVYQNNGCVLLEVNSIDTSKTCHQCGYINHDLAVGEKAWECPNCHAELNRDLNATYNIRDWSLDPKKHAVMKQRARYQYLSENDLVKVI